MNSWKSAAPKRKMSSCILDASALLALLNKEAGYTEVEGLLPDAAMSTVNLCEVAGKLIEKGGRSSVVRSILDGLGLHLIPFDRDIAYRTGELRKLTAHAGLSLGDRACLATGQKLKVPVYTADRVWTELGLNQEVFCIR
jgi:ribonuclease VapC